MTRFLTLAVLLGVACSTPAPKAPTADNVAEVASISKEIRANPDKASDTLTKHGLTAEQFETLMYDIAKDPAKASAYEAALK
jgi:hypothetical protein